MICPRWVATRCQPIAIRYVIEYLIGLLDHVATSGQTYDIGGPDVLHYRDLLEGYAEVRGLKRYFIPVPFLSPGQSSGWLYLMTPTTFSLVRALVQLMSRGRRHPSELRPGDPLDFWRVIVADRKAGRLMLYAEMKFPGEAWLEFRIEGDQLRQTATFRPQGIFGRLYWFAVLPFHWLLFPHMARRLADASD